MHTHTDIYTHIVSASCQASHPPRLLDSCLHLYIHTYICIKYKYMHMYVHTHTHTHTQTQSVQAVTHHIFRAFLTVVCIYTYIHLYQIQMCAYINTHTHTNTHIVSASCQTSLVLIIIRRVVQWINGSDNHIFCALLTVVCIYTYIHTFV